MQGGELFDRSWPCKLVPSDFLCFVFFTSFFSHLFFSIFLPNSVPIRLTEAWFPADSAILRSGAKETLHGKGCCSSYLSGNHPLKYPKHTESVLFPPAWWWRKCDLFRFRKSFLEVIISQNLLFQMLLAVNYIHSHDIVTWLEAAVEAWWLDWHVIMWSFNHCTASQVHRDIKLENFLYEAKAWCVRFVSLFFLPFLLGISGTSSWGLTLHCFALPLLNFSCRTLIIWSWLILVSATWLSPENMEVVDARATRVSPFHGVSGKIWHPNTTMAVSCGTLAYVAPEVLEKSYTSQCYLADFFQVKLWPAVKSSPNLRWFMEPWSGGIRATFWSLGEIFVTENARDLVAGSATSWIRLYALFWRWIQTDPRHQGLKCFETA